MSQNKKNGKNNKKNGKNNNSSPAKPAEEKKGQAENPENRTTKGLGQLDKIFAEMDWSKMGNVKAKDS